MSTIYGDGFVADMKTPEHCEYCGGSGEVHAFDGEWRGSCVCQAGLELRDNDSPATVPPSNEKNST